ncbi:DUF3152 domain-containing protein [Micromonospora sp. NPDC049679]|uniref:DUF3152 domain-containing protein n=1 Tax=Micromonospora sp. NPDC049679 TaxID=3155920 RepID=UPI0033F96B57
MLALAGGLVAVGMVVPQLARDAVAERPAGSPIGRQTVPPFPTAPATRSAAPSPFPVLRMAGRFPAVGPGTFTFGATQGPTVGRTGMLRRYRVAVERDTGEDVADFGAVVESALGDRRSWTGGGDLRLQRVPERAAFDFTVYLATAATASRMCLAGGVDIGVQGRPYTSCRAPGRVIINLDRWRLSVDHFVAAQVPLATYRAYVVNHEVGHELGNGHEACPGAGRPAPVMTQQTLFLNGCVANPWPYLDGRRYAGPLL